MKKPALAVGLLAAATFASAPAGAQTFQNGPYYANPSWDQQIPAAQRFIVLSNWSNQAVLDRETGLVWERTPSGSTLNQWALAASHCARAGTGNRLGWRIPSIQELASLIDPASSNMLPSGNPFQGVAVSPNFYWSVTTDENSSILAWVVFFGAGLPSFTGVSEAEKTDSGLTWCVRGGAGLEFQ